MSWSRLCLLLLLAVAVPVQAIAAASAPLTPFSSPTSGMPMDCHGGQANDVPEPPSCCGDVCPDMTVCAAAHAVSATTVASSAVGPATAPDDCYLLPPVSSRLSSPFRPPTLSHV